MAIEFGNDFFLDMWSHWFANHFVDNTNYFHLLTGSWVFDPADDASQFSGLEATFDGYSPIDMYDCPFMPAYINADGEGEVDVVDPITWTVDGTTGLPQTITGWYLANDSYTPGKVYWCERFGAGILLSATGNVVTIQPALKDKLCNA